MERFLRGLDKAFLIVDGIAEFKDPPVLTQALVRISSMRPFNLLVTT